MKSVAIGLTALVIGFSLPAFGQQKREARDKASSSRVTVETKGNQKIGKFSSEDYQSERVLHDFDQDGWCDIWCGLFQKEIQHRSKNTDTDGDGLTDYEEMVLMRNPSVAEPLPKRITAEDRAQSQKNAEVSLIKSQKEWEARKQRAFAKGMKRATKVGRENEAKRVVKMAEKIQLLRQQAQAGAQEGRNREALLAQEAKKHGLEILTKTPGGKTLRFIGAPNDFPVFSGGHDQLAAASISADELWPAAAAPWASGSTGLDLTGSGQTVSMWENAGGVRVAHNSFGSRVNQRDNAGLGQLNSGDASHATEVCGIIAAFDSTNPNATGVAYGADVEAFDIANFKTERESAASGLYGGQALTFSNHSYGVVNGWRQEIHSFVGNTPVWRWYWYGPDGQAPADLVDPKFGRYTEDVSSILFDCVEIDHFSNAEAPHHLLVYSCGNDRNEGPGDAFLRVKPNNLQTNRYFLGTTGAPRNPAFFPKDWSDGDAGGYDSVSSPGTSKNVITVGSVEDIVHNDNGTTVPGVGPGAVVNLAPTSGAGPTDDGRIKPDLVAVGRPSASARSLFNIPVTDGLVTPSSATNTSYEDELSEGTSFSAPAVTGGIALVLERRSQLYPNLPATDLWLNSTLKAIAINGCDNLGSEGPDFYFGHGVFNAVTSVNFVDEDHTNGRGSSIKEITLQPNETVSWLVEVDGNEPLAITAAWSDPAGIGQPYTGSADTTTPALVNNIDLKIRHLETNTTLLPWVLKPDLVNQDSSVRDDIAERGIDSINNVERITNQSPDAGTYEVTLTHSGGLANSLAPSQQDVSVVLSNAVPLMATIQSIAVSPTLNEFIIEYFGDPGAHFDIETSTDLVNWTVDDTTEAEQGLNTIMVTTQSTDVRRFWRLKRP